MANVHGFPIKSIGLLAHDVPENPAVLIDWRDYQFTIGIVPFGSLFPLAIDGRVRRVDAVADTHQSAIDGAYALARHLGCVTVVDRALRHELPREQGDAA